MFRTKTTCILLIFLGVIKQTLQMKRTLTIVFVFCIIYSAFGQVNCVESNLIGGWKQVQTLHNVYTNIDSLKNIITNSDRIIGGIFFGSDNTTNYTFLDLPVKRIRYFSFDPVKCQIMIGNKKKVKEKSNNNLEIIYLDSKFLIFKEDNNPKGYVTHLFAKILYEDR
jgi:hypothetical protein